MNNCSKVMNDFGGGSGEALFVGERGVVLWKVSMGMGDRRAVVHEALRGLLRIIRLLEELGLWSALIC